MLDTESLLRPIREDAPTGENLRNDPSPTSPYYQIKDARNVARSVERAAQMAEDPASAPAADWRPVLELAPKLLSELSKDLEIAVWLIEAQVRQSGFSGLTEGFRLVRLLLESYWDGIHPLPDEEGIATRVAPLTGLNGDESEGTLIVPIGMVPLLYDEYGALSTWHYSTAREVAAIADPEARQRRIEAGAVPLERFQAAVSSTDPSELFSLLEEVEQCMQEFLSLSNLLDQLCGSEAPPTSNIRQSLQEVLDCLGYLTKDLAPPASAEDDGAAGGGGGDGSAQPAAAPGVIATRQDAIEAMRRAGEFFRRTEPHSPISYMVDKALRWSQMPLHLLVGEMISDPAALADFQLRTGVPTTPSSEQSEG